MSLEQSVSQHYTHGGLEAALLDALQRAGKDLDALTYADLAVVDEFHIGGRPATRALGEQIDLPAGTRVLDIGCGIGGPARFFAAERGWKVDGVDLTAEYVDVAQALSRRVGMADAVTFRQASATALPFSDATFDGAYMLHVGMNIADKKAVFAEVRRVLRPGGIFGIYDAMRESDGTFAYPVPWSSEPATNHIDRPDAYRSALAAAGFSVIRERNRRDFALQAMQQRTVEAGKPIGLPVVMGAAAAQKLANMRTMIEGGVFAPYEIIARAVTP
ncbi:MAG: class I SAM-dependent methyltransferase [Enhydrobacter sp.]|nr:class I SAM-dependent methyltransferase [Enhydrobacter sp.]